MRRPSPSRFLSSSWRTPDGRRLMLTVGAGTAVVALAASSLAASSFGTSYSHATRVQPVLGISAVAVLLVGAVAIAVLSGAVMDEVLRARSEGYRMGLMGPRNREWVWEAGPGGIITSTNSGVTDLLGYQPSQIVGRSTFDLMSPGDRSLGRTLMDLAVETVTGWEGTEAGWLHADGHEVRLIGTAEPILDRNGRAVGYRGVRALPAERAADLADRRAAVRAIIDERAFEIALQPIVDIESQKWVGVEALARFHGRPPPEVLAEAERVGLETQLEIVLADAAFAALPHLPPEVYLSINLSPAALVDPRAREMMSTHQEVLDRITIELTERIRINDYGYVLGVLHELRRAGLKLAVDDAGAGYSSFLHIIRLHPDIIKLDRQLVAGIGKDSAKKAVAKAVCELGANIGAALIAEGVETAEDSRAAAAEGLTLQQGYAIAMPSQDGVEWAKWHETTWTA